MSFWCPACHKDTVKSSLRRMTLIAVIVRDFFYLQVNVAILTVGQSGVLDFVAG